MRNLDFYNIPLRGKGIGGLLLSPFRRAARKLMLPFFAREVEILNELVRRLDHGDHIDESLRVEVRAPRPDPSDEIKGLAHALACLNIKYDCLNVKFDQLNLKFDQLNTKMDSLYGHFEEIRAREDALREEFAALVAMNWDHVAVSRRLAQLEDRLIADANIAEPGNDPSIRFPGLDRFDRTKAV